MATTRLCSIPDCDKPAKNAGMCWGHYSRLRRHGDPLKGGPTPVAPASPNCTVEGCSKPHWAHGLCQAHYTRQRRYDDPLGGTTGKGEPLQWIFDHANYEGDDCLIWPYGKGRDDYGVVLFRGVQSSAPKVMCTIAHGEAPSPNHETAHNCGHGDQSCINPKHIRWDTRSGNHADKLIHGTHLRGERSPTHKLTEDDVRQIRRMRRKTPIKALADRYGVTVGLISAIQLHKRWTWLE